MSSLRLWSVGIALLGTTMLGTLGAGLTGCTSDSKAAPNDGLGASDGLLFADLGSDGSFDRGPRGDGFGADGGAQPFPEEANLERHAKAGSRLEARWLTTPDGRRFFDGWYDQQLKSACSFQLASDQKLRCLPTATRGYPGWSVAFANERCRPAERLAWATTAAGACAAAPPLYVTTREGCVSRVYRGRGLVSERTPYAASGASCVALSPQSAFLLAEKELEPTTFVKGTVVEGPSAFGLAARYIAAADGSVGVHTPPLVDTVRGTPCAPGIDAEGAYRCASGATAIGDYFSDAGCTVPIALVNGCTADNPYLLLPVRHADGCSWHSEMRHRGLTLALSTVFQQTAAGCGPIELTASHIPVALGEVVPAAELPLLSPAAPQAIERLARSTLQASTLRLPFGPWYDKTLGTECTFEFASDGKIRCLPSAPSYVALERFVDETCQTEAIIKATSTCPRSELPLHRRTDTTSCPHRVRVFSLGAAYAGPLWGKAVGGACESQDITGDNSFFKLGSELPASGYGELQ